jgi:hypothetical protein
MRWQASIRDYFASGRRRAEILREARELLVSLQPTAAAAAAAAKLPVWKLMEILMHIGLGHLRGSKLANDAALAARDMELRIQSGPRPSREEAHLN